MKPHMQILINLLVNNDFETMLQHYLAANETENIEQLSFLFQQGQIKSARFDFYQAIATKFIESKNLPTALIAQFKTSELLSFFTPALQLKGNFNKTNQQQRNVLHFLLTGNQTAAASTPPPFNYLRSMMLFDSNESLRDALCQRDSQNFTPIEAYLIANTNLSVLPSYEFTALLALIEIENKQQPVDSYNYIPISKAVSKLCARQEQPINSELQRLILIAAYFTKPIKQILNDVN